jgi:hypothetical protein
MCTKWMLITVCVLRLIPAAADAQERKGIVTGLLTDPAHAVLQGASVEPQIQGASTSESITVTAEQCTARRKPSIANASVQREYYDRTVGAGLRWNSVER